MESEESWTVAGARLVVEFTSWERRRRRIAAPLSEEEHEKHWFRIWCGFCLCLLAFAILVCR